MMSNFIGNVLRIITIQSILGPIIHLHCFMELNSGNVVRQATFVQSTQAWYSCRVSYRPSTPALAVPASR